MSNTEKLIKQLNENKEIRKLQEKVVKPAVRIQQVKNNLIILAHDLLVSKKINDSLYRKIQLLTYSKTTEKKLNESYDTLKKLKTTVKKSEELQGLLLKLMKLIFLCTHFIKIQQHHNYMKLQNIF